MPKISFGLFLAIVGLIMTIVLVVLDKAGKLKGPVLLWLLFIAALMTLPLAISNPAVGNVPNAWKWWVRGLLLAVVMLGYWAIFIWVSGNPIEQHGDKSLQANPTPSFLFVIGVPLGDNDSATWMMLVKHYGPTPAHNCNIDFYDGDRGNIEHLWLVAHPNLPFPPPGLAQGESRRHVFVAEAGPEGSAGEFRWNPLDPDRQHYTVSISCRDGVFAEKWEVTRVEGILRSTITVEHGPEWIKKNPTLDPVVFKCSDPEFLSTPLATKIPNLPKKVVHPGWKPNHRFEVPAAIIDSNGNLQVISAVRSPDGGTTTDFGCWNLLTSHLGDKQNTDK